MIPMRISTPLAYDTSAVWISLPGMAPTSASDVLLAPLGARALVLGAPGSGKTTLLANRLVHLVSQGVNPDAVMILTPTRSQASALRDPLGLALAKTTQGPRVRSVAALAFSIVEAFHHEQGLAAPDLLQASQIDADIEALLAGHIDDGSGPDWPAPLSELVRSTPSFRGELREWMARASENGLTRGDLERLSATHHQPAWAAAAAFREEFIEVVSSARPGAFDSADIIRRAIVALESGVPSSMGEILNCGVDDAHDLTSAGLEFLFALARAGVGMTVVAEPDVAGNTFRGSQPQALSLLGTAWAITPVVLDEVHRHGRAIRASVQVITQRIGTAGAGTQRKATSSEAAQARESASSVFTLVAPGEGREANDVARLVVKAHDEQGIPYDRIAVIARRGSRVSSLVNHLSVTGVPVRSSLVGQALRDQPAARELLELVALARGLRPMTAEGALAALSGLYGGMTQQELRRLRFALRVSADPDLPYQSADAMMAESLGHRGGFALFDSGVAKKAQAMAEMLDDVRKAPSLTPITDLLWTIWDNSGVADLLVSHTHTSGTHASFAHQALDSVVALFRQASDFVDASPGAQGDVFIESLLSADVPDDVVLPEPAWPAVLVATPPGVAGAQYDLVIVTGVDDQVWPDLRLRGSLLAAHLLSGAARGEPESVDERRIVLEDELRLFALALSRACTTLVVIATESEESRPSPLFYLVDKSATRIESAPMPPPSPRTLVGHLRRELVQAVDNQGVAAGIADDLAALAKAGVPGANPQSWWGLAEVSSTTPLYPEGPIPVSPSSMAVLEESPIEWFLGAIARNESSPARGLGSLLHHAWEEHPEGDPEAMWSDVAKNFAQLEFEPGWIENYQRRLAQQMVNALADYTSDRLREGWSVVATEQKFRVVIGRAEMTGYIDRIESSPQGELLVVDLKTGNPKTDNAIADDPQLFAYQMGIASREIQDQLPNGQARIAGAGLLFVKKGVRGKTYRLSTQPPMDAQSSAAFASRIEEAAKMIASAEFSGEPMSFGAQGTPARHRWHFIAQVCGDV